MPRTPSANLAIAVELVRARRNVSLRHVSLADRPEPAPSTGPTAGDRRLTYDTAGTVLANLVYGVDGAWHETDEPPPGPRG